MALYTPTSFLKLLKQDIGIKNITLPVDDKSLYDRFCESALKEFSVRSPRIQVNLISDNERLNKNSDYTNRTPIKYRIPKHYYIDSEVLMVTRVDVAKPLGYSDLYVPQGMWASPDSVLTAISDVHMAASVAASMGKALTYKFEAPDVLYLYNAWTSGVYEIEIGLVHDKSLSTIQPTQFTNLRKLAVLDLQEYLYNELSRLDNLEVGIGTIDLKIDRWADAADKKADLLKEWDDDSSLSIDNIVYF